MLVGVCVKNRFRLFSTAIAQLCLFLGNAVVKVKCNSPIKLMTVRGTSFDAVKPDGGSAAKEDGKIRFERFW